MTAQRTRYCSPADKENLKLIISRMHKHPRRKISKYFCPTLYSMMSHCTFTLKIRYTEERDRENFKQRLEGTETNNGKKKITKGYV